MAVGAPDAPLSLRGPLRLRTLPLLPVPVGLLSQRDVGLAGEDDVYGGDSDSERSWVHWISPFVGLGRKRCPAGLGRAKARRFALPRQPCRFESLGAIRVFFVSDNPPIADGVDDSASVLNPGIAALELAAFVHHRHDHLIAGVDELR